MDPPGVEGMRTALDERVLRGAAARDEAALDRFFGHFFDRVHGYVL